MRSGDNRKPSSRSARSLCDRKLGGYMHRSQSLASVCVHVALARAAPHLLDSQSPPLAQTAHKACWNAATPASDVTTGATKRGKKKRPLSCIDSDLEVCISGKLNVLRLPLAGCTHSWFPVRRHAIRGGLQALRVCTQLVCASARYGACIRCQHCMETNPCHAVHSGRCALRRKALQALDGGLTPPEPAASTRAE